MAGYNEKTGKNPSDLPPNTEWDSLTNFAGETNINRATGKKRTFTDFDKYPRQKGESNEEYGARLKKIHEETAKYQAEYDRKQAEEAYRNSEQGKKVAEINADFDRISDKLDQAVKEGRMSAEHAEKLRELQLNRAVDEVSGLQQDYQDRQAVGDPEEEARYRAWLKGKDDGNTANLGDRKYTVVDDEYKVMDSSDGNASPDNSDSPDSAPGKQQPDDDVTRLSDDDVDVLPPDPNRIFPGNRPPQITGPTIIDQAPQLPGPTIGDQAPQLPGPTIGDQAPQLPGPTTDDQAPQLPGPVQGEKNKVEIGKIDIDTEFVDRKFAENKSKELEEVEKELNDLRPAMAELYAKNRRLIIGAENRTQFIKNREKFSKLLEKCWKLKGEKVYEEGKRKNAKIIDARIEELRAEIEKELTEFAGGDLEHSEKSQEEINAKKSELAKEKKEILEKEYGKLVDELKTDVNCNFLENFIKEDEELREETNNKIDKGNLYRRFVDKVVNNKKLKTVLVGAAVAGLAVTGVGLIAGGVSIGIGFTAGGVAAGALKGGFSGFLMSRQNSKNSAVNRLVDKDEIKKQIEGIDITSQDASAANVIKWYMDRYGNASEEDRRSNIKKTAISVGLGAAIGGLTSGIHFNNVVKTEQSFQQQTGTTPVNTEYNVEANLSQVNQPQGTGLYKTMEQMGIPKDKWSEALDIAYKVEPKYGLSPGSNGVVPGFNGTVGRLAEAYPGPIDTWPDTAQAFITETAKEWAKQGLMPSEVIRTGGEPIYSTITNVVTEYIPNAFMNFLTRATATTAAGAIGGAIGGSGRANRAPASTAETAGNADQSTDASLNRVDGYSAALNNNPNAQRTTSNETAGNTHRTFEQSLSAVDDYQQNVNGQLGNSTANPGANTSETSTETDTGSDVEFDIPTELRDTLGSEGVELLTSKDGFQFDKDNDRFTQFWNRLPQNIKEQIDNLLFNEHPHSQSGSALRVWRSAERNNASNQVSQ